MGKTKCTVEDLIKDKIALLEDAKKWSNIFKNNYRKASYEPPPLWDSSWESNIRDWKKFRLKRRKMLAESNPKLLIEFPLASFDLTKPGSIFIIEDDCSDLLKIFKFKIFQGLNKDFVRDVFFAADITIARLHFMTGHFDQGERIHNATKTKRIKREKDKKRILDIFNNNFKSADLNLISKNKASKKILSEIEYKDISLNKVKYLLKELQKDGLISVPW